MGWFSWILNTLFLVMTVLLFSYGHNREAFILGGILVARIVLRNVKKRVMS